MPSSRKRKVNAVDSDKEEDGDIDSNDVSSEAFSLDESDSNDEEFVGIDQTKKKSNKRKISTTVPIKQEVKIEARTIKTPKKKDKEKSPSKQCRKNVVIKAENHDGVSEKTPRGRKKMGTVDLDSYDIVLPASILNGGGSSSDNQCALLVEVSDSKDAIALGEFGGSIGAIGRFESDPNGITLDLKGNQYRGSLIPGPTCLVVGFPQSFGAKRKDATTESNGESILEEENKEAGTLRVEGIVDEYATLVQIDDHMKKLDAVVIENNDENSTGAQDK